MNDAFLTPANQQRTTDGIQPTGSASTIVDPSAQASSAVNTPHEGQSSTTKIETQHGSSLNNYRMHSTSPLDTRRATNSNSFHIATDAETAPTKEQLRDLGSSPLTSRAQLAATASPRAGSRGPDKGVLGMSRIGDESPFRHAKEQAGAPGITAGSGLGFSGTGRFSIR